MTAVDCHRAHALKQGLEILSKLRVGRGLWGAWGCCLWVLLVTRQLCSASPSMAFHHRLLLHPSLFLLTAFYPYKHKISNVYCSSFTVYQAEFSLESSQRPFEAGVRCPGWLIIQRPRCLVCAQRQRRHQKQKRPTHGLKTNTLPTQNPIPT